MSLDISNFKHIKSFHNCSEDHFRDELKPLLSGLEDLRGKYNSPIPQLKAGAMETFSDQGFVTNIRISEESALTVNGVRGDTGFQVQFGNAARFHIDLLKFQYIYEKNRISKLIYVCLENNFVKKNYAQNLITYERAKRELVLFKKVIKVPICLIGLGLEE